MYFVFTIKIRHKSVPRDSGRITRKEMSKLFSRDYATTSEQYGEIRRIVNFEEIDVEHSAEKNDEF